MKAFEKQIERKLSDKEKQEIINSKVEQVKETFSKRTNTYQGGYYGEEKTSLSILPEFLRQDDLTDWLFVFQIQDKQNAALFIILKNPILTPFVEDGLGRTDNEFNSFDIDDWWRVPYEPENEENSSKVLKNAFRKASGRKNGFRRK